MKTTKIFSAALLIAMISTTGLSSVSAYGQWSSMTEEQREEIQNMTDEEKQEYMEENGKEMRDDDNDGIPNKDDEDYVQTQAKDGTNKSENAWTWNWDNANENWSENKSDSAKLLKTRYKNTYEDKYGSLISRMDDTKLNVFIEKIDWISEKVNLWDYSEELKEKFNAMLDALKEIAEENLDDEGDDILDSLFE